jgi:Fe2+ transport system protein FeoA
MIIQSTLSLSDFKPGDEGRILGFHKGNAEYRQKLLSMGLTPNTPFKVIRYAPLGDPIQIQVRNFFLSLRKKEAQILLIERATAA